MEGHTLIVPSEHTASARSTDEATWTEMRNFKKSLIMMFRAQAWLLPLWARLWCLHCVRMVICWCRYDREA